MKMGAKTRRGNFNCLKCQQAVNRCTPLHFVNPEGTLASMKIDEPKASTEEHMRSPPPFTMKKIYVNSGGKIIKQL